MTIYRQRGYRRVAPQMLSEALASADDALLYIDGLGPLEKRGLVVWVAV